MKKILFHIFLVFLSEVFFSQGLSPLEDSVLKRVAAEKIDSLKASGLNELAFQLRRNNPESAIRYAEQALKIYETIKHPFGQNYSYYIIGTARMNLSDYGEAFRYLNICIENSRRYTDKRNLARAYNNVGIIYIKQGNYPSALEYYLKALSIREAMKENSEIASSLLNIGNIHFQQKNYEEALRYYTRALRMYNQDNKLGIANAYRNTGLVHQRLRNHDTALFYYRQSLALNKEIGDIRGIASGYESISDVYREMKKPGEAEKMLEQAMILEKQSGNLSGMHDLITAKAEIMLMSGKYKEARKIIKQTLPDLVRTRNIGQLSASYHILSSIDSSLGNFKDAHSNFRMHITYKDSLLNEHNTKMIVQHQMNFDFSKKEASILREQQKREILAGEELNRQKTVTLFSSIAGVLILILFGISFMAYRNKKKSHEIITAQKAEVELQRNTVQLQKHLIEEKQLAIIDSINYARRLQDAILPAKASLHEMLPDSFLLFLPKDIVAGDFYWIAKANSGQEAAVNLKGKLKGASAVAEPSEGSAELFYLAVCDCTGHGVPGAFMSLLNIGLLSEAIKERGILEPDKILNYVRDRLSQSIGSEGRRDGMDGALLCFDRRNGKITYSAAHNGPLLVSEGKKTALPADKMPVGQGERTDAFSLHEIIYSPGDMIYLFTDGYADQFGGPKGKKLKNKTLEELLLKVSVLPVQEQGKALQEAFNAWKGELDQVDDVCVFGMRLK